jgi:hypothetical protein
MATLTGPNRLDEETEIADREDRQLEPKLVALKKSGHGKDLSKELHRRDPDGVLLEDETID